MAPLTLWQHQGLTMAKTHIYIVHTPNGVRLVRASVRSQALSYVASTMMNIHFASQEEIVECMESGVKVENAKSPDQQEIEL